MTDILPSFPTAVADLPSAAENSGRTIYVTEDGGPTEALSDGINWRRVSDNSIVS
jgi:hypothetical protein